MHRGEFDVGVIDAGALHNESDAPHVWKRAFQNFRHGFGSENELRECFIGHFENVRSVVTFWNNDGKSFGVRVDGKKCRKVLVFPKQTQGVEFFGNDFAKNAVIVFGCGVVFRHRREVKDKETDFSVVANLSASDG